MVRWETLGSATAPGGGELRLMRRGEEFSITVGGEELMNSRRGGSETALGALACARLTHTAAPGVLIGGLGLGFTLRAALAAVGPHARIVVAELVPEVIAWARGPLAPVFAGCLDDPRVDVVAADVRRLIEEASEAYDAILLDVDNGPAGLVSADNDGLYDAAGLSVARSAIRPGGVLAIWSAGADAPFVRRLREAGFDVDEAKVGSGGRRAGARHVVWLATPVRGPASQMRSA